MILSNYLPTQNLANISFITFSSAVSPLIKPKYNNACLISIVIISSGITQIAFIALIKDSEAFFNAS